MKQINFNEICDACGHINGDFYNYPKKIQKHYLDNFKTLNLMICKNNSIPSVRENTFTFSRVCFALK